MAIKLRHKWLLENFSQIYFDGFTAAASSNSSSLGGSVLSTKMKKQLKFKHRHII